MNGILVHWWSACITTLALCSVPLLCSILQTFSSCHGLKVKSLASHHGGPGSISSQWKWDMWWRKWHWDRFCSKHITFPLSVSFNWCLILIHPFATDTSYTVILMVGSLLKRFWITAFNSVLHYCIFYWYFYTHMKLGTFHSHLTDLLENGNQARTCWMVIKYSCDL
jgi:hypothetical protein